MKAELRYKYKVKRKYFQHSAREVADGAIADIIMEAFGDRESFFIYHSFSSEADTHGVIAKLLEAGKRVYLPKTVKGEMYPVRYTGNAEELEVNSYGIAEPRGQACQEQEAERIEVCITPLLAVNSRGYRLGYGGGFYDRFFQKYGGILRVGMGYFLQYTDEFQEELHDYPLDMFVCERGIIYFGK